jgi:hypothetical protein
MIQITPQMRILVAVESVDFRAVPAEAGRRSIFGLPVCVPQPASNLY